MSQRHPINCILPPHILEGIAREGNDQQKAWARATLQSSELIRDERRTAEARTVAAAVQAGAKERIVYDAGHNTNLPGTVVRSEGAAPTNDAAVNEAYDGSGDTYDLFQQVYQRDSLDGAGMKLKSTVHYGVGFDNAFWNGSQMVYGDGDEDLPPAERLFNRFTIALEIVGHELTHGVVDHTADLEYQDQSGALNEHFADVFGSLVRQWKANQSAAAADWIIGKGLLTARVNGLGIRSMKAPGTAYDDPVLGGKDPQPAHMNDFVTTQRDRGGVHINSGIPNQAFYLVATELAGNAWERAGRIWYKSLTDSRLGKQATFQEAANLTYAVAGAEFGAGSLEQQAVANGWKGVGITVDTGGTVPPPGRTGCLGALLTMGLAR